MLDGSQVVEEFVEKVLQKEKRRERKRGRKMSEDLPRSGEDVKPQPEEIVVEEKNAPNKE